MLDEALRRASDDAVTLVAAKTGRRGPRSGALVLGEVGMYALRAGEGAHADRLGMRTLPLPEPRRRGGRLGPRARANWWNPASARRREFPAARCRQHLERLVGTTVYTIANDEPNKPHA